LFDSILQSLTLTPLNQIKWVRAYIISQKKKKDWITKLSYHLHLSLNYALNTMRLLTVTKTPQHELLSFCTWTAGVHHIYYVVVTITKQFGALLLRIVREREIWFSSFVIYNYTHSTLLMSMSFFLYCTIT